MPTPQPLRGIASVAICLAVTLSCVGCAGDDPTPSPTPDVGPQAAATVDHTGCRRVHAARQDGSAAVRNVRSILAVSIDGLRPAAIRRLGTERAPTLHRLIRQGASTLNARTTVEETRTLPNHTTMLTGRRVAANRGGHGVDVNTDPGGTVHDRAGERVASIFQVVARRGGRPALFAAKSKFAYFQRSWPCSIARFTYRPDNQALTDAVRLDLTQHRRTLRFCSSPAPMPPDTSTDSAHAVTGTPSQRPIVASAGWWRSSGPRRDCGAASPQSSPRTTAAPAVTTETPAYGATTRSPSSPGVPASPAARTSTGSTPNAADPATTKSAMPGDNRSATATLPTSPWTCSGCPRSPAARSPAPSPWTCGATTERSPSRAGGPNAPGAVPPAHRPGRPGAPAHPQRPHTGQLDIAREQIDGAVWDFSK